MKGFILLMLLVSLNAFAFPVGYQTIEIYDAFKKGEADIATNASDIDAIELVLPTKVNIAVLDLNVTATLAAAATVTFPTKAIPANAIIKNSWYEVQTQVVSANDNTLALACASVTIDTASDLTDVVANTIAAADITATAATYKNVGASPCVPTITVGAGASGVTAGRVRWFVEYVTR